MEIYKCDICGNAGKPGRPITLFCCEDKFRICRNCLVAYINAERSSNEIQEYYCVKCHRSYNDNQYAAVKGKHLCKSCQALLADVDTKIASYNENQEDKMQVCLQSDVEDEELRDFLQATIEYNDRHSSEEWNIRKKKLLIKLSDLEKNLGREDKTTEIEEILTGGKEALQKDDRDTD